MRLGFYLIIIYCLIINKGFTQKTSIDSLKIDKRSIVYCKIPCTKPIHPLGIFSAGNNNNFKYVADSKSSFNVSFSSANIWLPKINIFKVTEPDRIEMLSDYHWKLRIAYFNEQLMENKKISITGDGVMREFTVDYTMPFKKKHEFNFLLRSYYLGGGEFPFSIITNDGVIEFFHTYISGGDDPFGRKKFDFNEAGFEYIDENAKSIKIEKQDFFIPGFEINYSFYPDLLQHKDFYLNIGTTLGVNFHNYNQSLDIGISGSVIKSFKLAGKNNINIGLGGNILKQRLFKFKESADIINKKFVFGYEGFLEYNYQSISRKIYSFSVKYSERNPFLSGFPKRENYKYLVFKGERVSNWWDLAGTHLYSPYRTLTFMYTYSCKVTVSLYFTEDIGTLSNAPDIQTGIIFCIPIRK